MKIHNLYEDTSGESHWRDIEVDLSEKTATGRLSTRIPVSALIFRETLPEYDLDWHPAPRRQYIINLVGGVQITASDGESRVIGAGEVILVEDSRVRAIFRRTSRRSCATRSSCRSIPPEPPVRDGGSILSVWR